MRKVQEIVRSVLPSMWHAGYSKCYRDTSYTKTKRKVRFKFDWIRVREEGKFVPKGMKSTDPDYFRLYEAEQAFCSDTAASIKAALTAEGHEVVVVDVWTSDTFGDQVIITQEFPIEIKELA